MTRRAIRSRLAQGRVGHGLRLPALVVVAADLAVPDRLAERRAAGVPHREQRDLVVEVDEPLDDDLARARAPVLLRVLVRGVRASPRSRTTLWPLPDELMMGLTTHGIADRVERRAVLVAGRRRTRTGTFAGRASRRRAAGCPRGPS